MTCYELMNIAVSVVICIAVVVQAITAWQIRKFTKQQTQINRVNQWTAFVSAEALFVTQVLSQSLETIKVAKEQGEEVSEQLKELTKTVNDWVRKFRTGLDRLGRHLPDLGSETVYARQDGPLI